MTESFFKIIALLTALCTAVMLVSCGEKEVVAKDPNVPDNIISKPLDTSVSTVSENLLSVESLQPVTSAETPDETTVSAQTEEPVTTSEESENVPEPPLDTRAMKCLDIMNSDRVHLKFLQFTSFDGENISTVDREFYINGDDKIYVNDNVKTILHGSTATVVDYDEKVFYSYEVEGDIGLNFGYDRNLYELVSTSEENGVYTEVYTVTGTGITSTWEFSEDGSIRVSDCREDTDIYDLFSIELIEDSVPEMDFTVPADFTEVTDDSKFNY